MPCGGDHFEQAQREHHGYKIIIGIKISPVLPNMYCVTLDLDCVSTMGGLFIVSENMFMELL